MMLVSAVFANDACAGWVQRQHRRTKNQTKTVKAETSHKHIQKTHWNTQIVAQILQKGSLGASFGHPYCKNEAFGDTLAPQNRQSGPLGTILSVQSPHNEIFGLLLGAKGALWDPFGGPKASKWSLFGPLLGYNWAPWWLYKAPLREITFFCQILAHF